MLCPLNHFAADEESHFSLRKMAAATRKDANISKSLIEPLLKNTKLPMLNKYGKLSYAIGTFQEKPLFKYNKRST